MSCKAFIRDRAVLGSTLVVPVRVVWNEYLAYCRQWGFKAEAAGDFVMRVELEEGVTIRIGGHGRLRRCFDGIGLNAGIQDDWDIAA